MSKKMTIDGNTAAAHVAYAFSEVAAIYPITPSSNMAEMADEWAAQGRKNIFGQTVRIAEMQSEAGAAGAVHGSLCAGALTTTFTASQGLLLMIPNMYKIAGELLPSVFHVSARALAAHALNIFGDHADVMACRQTGFAMLCSNSVQEAMDLALVSHLATLKSKVPFLHFFDGFRTSHELSKIDVIDYDEMKSLVDMKDIEDFKSRALNPERPVQKGTAQNGDIYFQNREACNIYYQKVPAIVEECMKQVESITGRKYNLFDYYGADDAEKIIIMMGSGSEACEETVDYLNARGQKVGLVKVRLYRPFDSQKLIAAIPKTTKYITVLDRTKEPGSIGEPLYLDVCTALAKTPYTILGGRYGMGSKEFNPTMIASVYANMGGENKNNFSVGIIDDVTFASLPMGEFVDASPKGSINLKFYGLGSDGTVGANKNSIKIIGDHTDKYVQGYFQYDSKKSGGLTVSHLRFGDQPIKSSYLIDSADFVACHNPSYIYHYDMLSELKENGIFLLNSIWTPEEMDEHLPASVKNTIAKKKIKFYTLDGNKVLTSIGARRGLNTVMQAAFFKLANVIPYEDAERYIKEAIKKTYGKKGDAVVNMNYAAVDGAISNLIEVKYDAEKWATTTEGASMNVVRGDDYYKNVISPILKQQGDSLPVSAFNADGTVPVGTSKHEKRGIAVNVPKWIKEYCIQCNQCAMACPHAVIRPALNTPEQLSDAPETFDTKDAVGFKGYKYRIQISPYDCTGCGVCANVCPAPKGKALEMIPIAEGIAREAENWEYYEKLPEIDPIYKIDTVKGSQFSKPLFEFSGACAGCGETPYIKLVTQMFGDRMMIANATGCSSIYGGSAPTCPYTTNDKGHGPAWANSLFEDNAEFGYGFNLAVTQRREKIKQNMEAAMADVNAETKAAFEEWIANMEQAKESVIASEKVIEAIAKETARPEIMKAIMDNKDMLIKKSIWIFGGDGWAYDIGYGGLDHVLAQNEDVNILVLDTEVYSNTGGQASKSTPTGSIAKFAASGKRTKKKDLGMMAMSYGYVYVAQVSMGASQAQLVKALKEAEAYKGPSLIIAYAPCINHGINMSNSLAEEKRAVDAGYWSLYRYNPELQEKGLNPFVLDSKDPVDDYQSFLAGETRYASLKKLYPEVAEKLFELNEQEAKERIATYKRLHEGK
ncbi:MAG: pyruvate:ferredoxin (flavodoxin) oxidoreductase [Clostridiales bacterium]|nr:pyruvate:ferredoxin (flavodoxin) oxidoreductase [Clostridiales bacterium]